MTNDPTVRDEIQEEVVFDTTYCNCGGKKKKGKK